MRGVCRVKVTLSQKLLPQLDLLQKELLHRLCILQVWKLQRGNHLTKRRESDQNQNNKHDKDALPHHIVFVGYGVESKGEHGQCVPL